MRNGDDSPFTAPVCAVAQELQVDADVAFAIWTSRLPALLASPPHDALPLPLRKATMPSLASRRCKPMPGVWDART